MCSEVCKKLGIIFRLWGVDLEEHQLSALCSMHELSELRKGESLDVGPANVVVLLDGIFEISRHFFTAGDVLYLEHGGKIACISHEGKISTIRKRDLENVLGLATADRLCRAAKLVEAEEAEDVPVSFFIRRVPVVGTENMSVHEAARVMRRLGISSIVIVDDEDKPLGIVTDTDLRRAIADQISPLEQLGKITTKPVHAVPESEPVSSVLERMLMQGIKHMVVVDRDGRVCGVTTLRDLYDAYMAVPLGYVRELQRCDDLDKLKFLYSRIVKQILNVISRRRVDVEEFSRNFSLFRMLTISRALSITSSNLESKVLVLVGGSLLTYDHVFGEDITVRVIGREDQAVIDVVKSIRRVAETLLDLREVISIDMYTLKDLLSVEALHLITDITYLSRPVWGDISILEELIRIHSESIFSQLPSLVREYCERIEIPLDFFGRLKVRTVNLYKDLLSVFEKILCYMYLLVTRARPSLKTYRIVDYLAKSRIIEPSLAKSIKVMYNELKQLALRLSVEKYIDRLQPTAIAEVDELSESELRHIVQSFELLRDLLDVARDVVSRFTAL